MIKECEYYLQEYYAKIVYLNTTKWCNINETLAKYVVCADNHMHYVVVEW